MSLDDKVVIIGAGIAGCSLAYYLCKMGYRVTIYDKGSSLASGASGIEAGNLYPRIDNHWSPVSHFYYEAFEHLHTFIEENNIFKTIEFHKVGAVILPKEKRDIKKFYNIDNYKISEFIKMVTPAEASDIAGIEIDSECLYLPKGGYLNLEQFCQWLVNNKEIKLNFEKEIVSINYSKGWEIFTSQGCIDKTKILIVANAFEFNKFAIFSKLKVSKVRGQLTYLPTSCLKQKIKAVVSYGGYITPHVNGYHHIGSTFDRDTMDPEVMDSSHEKNLNLLQNRFPNLLLKEIKLNQLSGRTSFRCFSEDKLPIIGNVRGVEGLYLSVGHGSRGIISAPLSAKIIASEIAGKRLECFHKTQELLSIERFVS